MDSLDEIGTMAGMETQPGFSLTHEERVALTFIAHNDPRDGFVRRTWLEFKTAICGLLQRTRASGWIPVSERLPEIATEGVSVTVIAAHVVYDLTMQGFVRTGELRSWPADYIGRDENGPWFKSMVTGRRLDAVAWMPLPEPPTE